MAIKRIARRFIKKFAKKLSAKQLAASRRNIKKAIAASARKRGKAIAGVARNPLKTYGGSIVKRTTKRRTKALARTASSLRITKMSRPGLVSSLESKARAARIAAGTRAGTKADYDVVNKIFKTNLANLERKGSKGVLGYFRASAVRKSKNSALAAKSALNIATADAGRTSRAYQVADKLVALNERQTIRLATQYADLSKGNTLKGYAGTLARDAALTGAVGVSAYAGYNSVKNKKKT